MFRSIRWRIAVPFATLWIVIMLALGGYLARLTREFRINELQSSLLSETMLLADFIGEEPFTENNAAAMNRTAREWSQYLDARVTIVALDGLVLGESDQDPEDMDNHNDRPEIISALESGVGTTLRFSATTGFERLYVARAVEQDGEIVGVIRLSVTLEQIDEDVATLQRAIFIATVMSIFLMVVMAVLIANRTTGPLRELTDASRKIAAGQYDANVIPAARDEVGDLARAMRQMAGQLQGQIRELDAERNKLAAILRQMNNGVMIISPERTIMLCNRAAEQMFGIEEEYLVGKSLVEGLRNHQIVELVNVSRSDQKTITQPLELPTRNRLLDMTAVPLGPPLAKHILLLFQDLTRIRSLETIRQDFISNISHELRTPLASLKALTETLLTGALEDPPAARRFLNRIETEVDSLALMVQELLELARIESGRVPLVLKPISPEQLVRNAVERLHLQAERAGLKVSVKTDPDMPPVLADPPRLIQVLMNLLHNAIKFTPRGGEITISVSLGSAKFSGFVLFSVRDTGVGIAADDLPRIFERFFKSDRARTRSEGGTGLGLAISRHLVEAHGGEIWAESRLEHGSSFYFSLPVADETD